jgi:phosphoglycerol transferase MdoB-like AlkP superfamily enzyme
VTNTEAELLAIVNGTRPTVTDMWEPVHIETATGVWDHEKELLERVGFTTVITAEEIGEARHFEEFDGSSSGFYDEHGLEYLWQYVDNTIARTPMNRMYLGWMSTTTHTRFKISPEWLERNYQPFVHDENWDSIDNWLNAVRWTDDAIKEIVLGFRERGLENDTLFLMYFLSKERSDHSHGDHGFPFAGEGKTLLENSHNEAYQIPMMIYNPKINNPDEKKVKGNFYALSIPTTILDLMIHTKSFAQTAQQNLARRFAQNYEFAQSLLRPVKETLRLFFVHPGGTHMLLDNSQNLRVIPFSHKLNSVYLLADPRLRQIGGLHC